MLASILQYSVACEEEYDQIVLAWCFIPSLLDLLSDGHNSIFHFFFGRVIRQIVDLVFSPDIIFLEAFTEVVTVFLCLENVSQERLQFTIFHLQHLVKV